jgi:hypothetical protein
MSEPQPAPNLQTLQDAYEIVGELRGGGRARAYMAKRRDNGADVIISVVGTGRAGENNALNHFAADTQLLSRLSHPHMLRVVEGKWLGQDQFAVVSERRSGSRLDELLGGGERFSPPRISLILQEVNTVLDWARTNGVVHRGVSPATVLLERETNAVLVSLEPTAVPVEGIPDAGADARTIGTLAWAMFTGKEYAQDQTLSALRPDLAKRVIDDTEAMVRSRSGAEQQDVMTYIAVVAAADALKTGEVEIAEMQAKISDQRLAELAAFESNQKACELRNAELQEQLANDRKEFERKMADEAAQLAAIKAEFESLKSSEESQLAIERTQVEVERAELAQERAAVEQRLAEREAELNARQAAVDRLRAEEGQRIDAAIAAAVETVAATAVVPPPGEEASDAWKGGAVEPEPAPWVDETVRQHSVGAGAPALAMAGSAEHGRPRWAVPTVTTLVLLALIALFAANRHSGPASSTVSVGKSTIVPTAPTTDVQGLPKGGFMTQSSGGAVGPPVGAPAGPPLSPDTTATSTAAPVANAGAPSAVSAQTSAADSAARAAAAKALASADKPKPKPKAIPRRVVVDSSSVGSGAFSAEADAIRRADAARRDSVARRDSLARPKPDTTVRPRPDTTGAGARR